MTRRGLRTIFLGALIIASQAAIADWSVPAELAARVEALSEQQRAFIESGAAIDVLPERQLIHELTTRDAGAPIDVFVWCRMTGHRLLEESHPLYLIQRNDS